MEVVTFRATGRQIRNVALFTLALSAVAAAIFLIDFAVGVRLPGRVFAWGVAAAICAPFVGWITLRYSRAVTECGPDAIRTRGLDRSWSCGWEYVADIVIRAASSRGVTTYTVFVRTTAGELLRLGVPVSGGAMRDPDFDQKVRQIRAYWNAAAGQGSHPADAPVVSSRTEAPARIPVAAVARGCVVAVLISAIVAAPLMWRAEGPALLARAGYGQPGVFTAAARTCEADCYWVGAFAAHGSAVLPAVPMTPGAAIDRAGQQVAAVHEGAENLVYPAHGGPHWIPLAAVLLILACCLAAVICWLISYLRRPDRARFAVYQPGSGRPRGRTLSAVSVGLITSGLILATIVAGVAIGLWVQDVPVSASPATTACAEYFAWASAQSEAGADINPNVLAAAAQAATGQLQLDLDRLQAAVTTASTESGTGGGLVAASDVLGDMTTADQACR
jgi:hypothetical protein